MNRILIQLNLNTNFQDRSGKKKFNFQLDLLVHLIFLQITFLWFFFGCSCSSKHNFHLSTPERKFKMHYSSNGHDQRIKHKDKYTFYTSSFISFQ
jgi:hypothetical protein